jgi:DNA-binding SARP family transcriptional activator
VAEWVQILAYRLDHAERIILHLFGSPFVTFNDTRIVVPEGSKRLVAFVALHHGRVERRYAAGALWPGGDDSRAAGNLRSALWRLNRGCLPLIEADKCSLSLRDEVVTDTQLVSDWANRLIDGSPTQADLDVKPLGVDALELLPGWYDDWALMQRELLRQHLLHALEALSAALVRAGRCSEAVDAAMLAATMEPLRESAQRALIEAHLAEGNWTEAQRRYDTYRGVVLRELGIEPHPSLANLLHEAAGGTARHIVWWSRAPRAKVME